MAKADQDIHHQRYVVVPRTLIFLFNSADKVLLIKGAANKRLWAGLYNGIGGHVETGENILSAAKRELFEETGIQNIPLEFCGQIMVDIHQDKGVALFVFYGDCENCPDSFKPRREGALDWVALKELKALSLVEDLAVLLPKVAAARSGRRFFFGYYYYDDQNNLNMSFIER